MASDKVGIKRLTPANKNEYFTLWSIQLSLVIRGEDVPSNYPGSSQLTEHLTKDLTLPTQIEYKKAGITTAVQPYPPEVDDVTAYNKAVRAWYTADGTVSTVVMKYLGEEYLKVFTRAANPFLPIPGTARARWKAL